MNLLCSDQAVRDRIHLIPRVEFCRMTEGHISASSEVAILALKVHQLREINETYGHMAGDALLEQVVSRMGELVQANQTLGRLSGDEFAILQTGVLQPNGARKLGNELVESLSRPYQLEGYRVGISVSVGITVAPFDARTGAELVRTGCVAMSHAAQGGRNQVRFFEPEMDERARSRRKLEIELRSAIDVGQFDLLYQPLLCLGTNRIVAAEALVRWQHPQLGTISPVDFIPLAEQTGLVVPLGRWVLNRACHDALSWPDDRRVAVNVSPVQLEDRAFVQTVREALDVSGLLPSRLELEITETSLVKHGDLAVAILSDLRDQGIRIALDDFGTGFSSINYLRQFPFDKIKIDRSFVSGVHQDPEATALVKMISALGIAISVSTTAEGIETVDELKAVIAAGCTHIQGFLLSKPIAHEQMVQFQSALPPIHMTEAIRGGGI